MKRPRTIAAVGLASLIALSAVANAQTNGTWRVSPEPNRRTGVETRPAPPTVVVVQPSPFPGVVFQQQVTWMVLPAVLLSDGTVLANFGMGYEAVTRSCGNSFVVSNEHRVIAGNGKVLSPGYTYPQTAPNQPTASQQMLGINSSRYPILTAASQVSCFSFDANGRPFVLRRN